jgi:6-phosphogluconolactonase
MGGTVSVHKYANGQTLFVERVATHPADFVGQLGSADIHVSADGKFLYASNRGKENNIAIFSVNEETGKLTPIGYESTKGEGPRNFSIDPTGKFLLVANQLTSTVEIFKRDTKTGLLKHSGNSLQIPNPVCLKFLKK